MSEEQLQHDAEKGIEANSADARAYARVFNVLKKEPGYHLAPGFEYRVIQRVTALQAEGSRDHWWLGAGIFFIVIAGIIAFAFVAASINLDFLKPLADYAGLVIAAAAMLAVFNWVDPTKRILTK